MPAFQVVLRKFLHIHLCLTIIATSASVVSGWTWTSRPTSRRAALVASGSFLSAPILMVDSQAAAASDSEEKPRFQRYPQIRFIAALGDPKASSGTGAGQWGIWKEDPGPRGVYLRNFQSSIVDHNNVAPAQWAFQPNDWWLEEHGLIMSNPDIPVPAKKYNRATQQVRPYKRYVVTGDRDVTTVLTVHDNGQWELQKGTLYDVTHLPCRSARYTPAPAATATSPTASCSPANADQRNFRVKPGAEMPPVPGCAKQDYAVLFVLGEEV